MRLRAAQRLFASYLLLILTLVLSLSLAADRLLRRHLVAIVAGDLQRELLLGREIVRRSARADPDSIADLLGRLTGRRVTLIAPDGRVVGESAREDAQLARMENHRDRPEVQRALRGEVGSSVRYSQTLEARLLYVAAPAPGGSVLRVSVPLSNVEAALQRVQRGIFGVGAVAVVLAALLSLGFSIAVTRPLRRVQAAATAMAAGDLSIRLRERRRDELGQLAGALDALADELQHRLAQLEDERAHTQALIDAMSEGVLALGPDGMLQHANPAAQQIFALPGDVAGLAPEAVSRRPEFLRLVRRVRDGQTVPPTQLVGDGRSLVATAQPLPDGGAVLVFLDTSELRRLEGVRRDFVANASHELKTPLTAIRGYSETLLDPGLPPQMVRRFAEVVKANADRLQRIVDDLLDLSRLESGGWVPQPEEVDVAAVAREAWQGEQERFEEKRICLSLELEPGAERAQCDPGALHQILCNLFSNALRYTPAGGTVTLRTRRLEPGPPPAPRGPHGVEIAVSDTGAGVPSVHLPRIFERFYRVDPARSRADGGTGLGLAIVRHLVEAHGGSIGAESQLGRGTTVRFTLPAVPG